MGYQAKSILGNVCSSNIAILLKEERNPESGGINSATSVAVRRHHQGWAMTVLAERMTVEYWYLNRRSNSEDSRYEHFDVS